MQYFPKGGPRRVRVTRVPRSVRDFNKTFLEKNLNLKSVTRIYNSLTLLNKMTLRRVILLIAFSA